MPFEMQWQIAAFPASNTTDTSSTTFSGTALGSMSAMSIKSMDTTPPPAAPTGLFATQDSGIVNLRWVAPASGDVAGYNVYRSTSPSVPLTGPINGGTLVTGTIYTDTGRTNGTPYYYVVTAVDTSANQSVASNEVSATPLASSGSAVQFDGTNDYVTFGPNLNATSFTLEAWVKRNATGGVTMSTGTNGFDGAGGRPNGIYPVVTKGMGEGEGPPLNINMNYFLGITSTGVVGADFEDNINGGNHPIWGNTVVPTGQWHHIAATYTGNCWAIYLDGVLDTMNGNDLSECIPGGDEYPACRFGGWPGFYRTARRTVSLRARLMRRDLEPRSARD